MLKENEIKVGDTHSAVLVEDLKRTQIVQYAGASGDYNPLHTDEIFTTQVAGYPSVFAHGMLSMGLTGTMLTDYVGDGALKKYGVRFTNQVWPGDTLTGKTTIIEIRKEDGEKVVDLIKTKIKLDKKNINTREAEEILKKISENSKSSKATVTKKDQKKQKITKKKK